ncbi:nitronate monooxygenase [uncultured Mycolicibacterium sp.]|uniref:nitronate monooxygenase n=1 Tax=uncultured Mycolicibacterium sp. TaxID=2320817 RepID=UPI0026317951|nr:nitronate monooxygenase [uncultured Mycolicibacterium sp.]
MTTRFDFRDLDRPVVAAPMAGGPSTPELAAAVTEAGGLGFLAAGYLTAEALAERITAARALTTGPLGVNLFVPHPSTVDDAALARYAAALAGEARRYGAEPGEPRYDDDAWSAKLDVVADLRPAVVSFTFGVAAPAEVARLRAAGITTVGSVTSADEARRAVAAGVDALVVQGPDAGGHRATFDPLATPGTDPLAVLLAAVRAAVDVPVLAAGGLAGADDVARVLAAGAVAAQCGTAFLLADEAGTAALQRAALSDPAFTETVVTKAFSGRYARGLRNRFSDEHDAQAPLGYPQVHYLTGPLRAAAARAGDPHGTNIWAGTGFRRAAPGPAAAVVAALAP